MNMENSISGATGGLLFEFRQKFKVDHRINITFNLVYARGFVHTTSLLLPMLDLFFSLHAQNSSL